MINKKILMIGFVTVLLFASVPESIKADVLPANTVYAVPPAVTQAMWNEYVAKVKATQGAMSSTYADEIIALNQTAIIDQAAIIHHFAMATPDPLATQATADWAAVNMLNANRDYFANLITYNPYNYTHSNSCFFPQYYR